MFEKKHLKTIFSKLHNHVPNDKPKVKCMMKCKGKVVGGKGDFAWQKTKKTPTSWSQGSAKDFAIDQDGTKWMEMGWMS